MSIFPDFCKLQVSMLKGKVVHVSKEKLNENTTSTLNSDKTKSNTISRYDTMISFHFISNDGKSKNIRIKNWDMDLYPSQEVILYFLNEGNKSILYKIKNVSTNEWHENTKEIFDNFFTTSWFIFVIPLILVVAYFLSSLLMAFLSIIIYFIGRGFLRRRFFNVIKDKEIAQERKNENADIRESTEVYHENYRHD